MSKTRDTGFINNILKYDNDGNVSVVSGSTTLLFISSSGAIITTGIISGSNALSASYAVSASNALAAQTASYVLNAQSASYVLTAQTSSFVANAQSASNAVAAQTASFVANAQSASNAVVAQTASYANAFTVAGTLTAQTLVVQTITSSVDFVTGSTRFGSILGNTHVFSGSVTMNPNGLFVSSSGNVGIGTTTPGITLDIKLDSSSTDITGSGASSLRLLNTQASNTNNFHTGIWFRLDNGINNKNGYIKLLNDASNATGDFAFILTQSGTESERVRIKGNGNVGIGTTSPQTLFTVSGANQALGGAFNTYGNVLITSNEGPAINRGGSFSLGGRYWTGNTTIATFGRIHGKKEDASDGSTAGYLSFETTREDGALLFERMRINSVGNVGIANSSPQGKLHIGDALFNVADASNGLILKQTGTNETTGIYLERSGERKGYAIYVGGSLDSLVFQRNNAGTKSDVMTLTRDGLVGIGNQNPTTRLVVNNSIAGAILPYINGTGLSYNSEGISVAGSNTNNGNIGNGLTLYNNVASVGAYSPVIAFSSMTPGGAYNATYAFITGIYQGAGGDSNWAIGDLMFGTGNAYGAQERMRITSGGNLLVGQSTADLNANGWQLQAAGGGHTAFAINNNEAFIFNNRNSGTTYEIDFRTLGTERGKISVTDSGVSYITTPSDLNLKKNFEDWDENVLNNFKNLNPQKFNFATEEDDQPKTKGFIAQELVESFPEAYPKSKDRYFFNPSGMVVYLMKAIQEQQAQIDELKAIING
jgi:hypothetical protein